MIFFMDELDIFIFNMAVFYNYPSGFVYILHDMVRVIKYR
jgi:hypothetical protein